MNKHPIRFWIVVVALGFASDYLFWGQYPGINYAIFLTLALGGGFFLLLSSENKPARQTLWLAIIFLFFNGMTFSRKEPLSWFLAVTFSLFPLGILVVTYAKGQWIKYTLFDYLYQFILLLESAFAAPIIFINQLRAEHAERNQPTQKLPFGRIVIGLLIAIPVVSCFGALFASADPVFNQTLINFFALFNFNKFPEYFLRLVIILTIAYFLAAIFLHAANKSPDEKLLGENGPQIEPFLGFLEAEIVSGSVAVLFLFFVIIQFKYFFGGNANIGVAGFTYSQYARRGFNELVLVAFLSLLMILVFSIITRRETDRQKNIFSGLNIAIVVMVIVILVSAFQRLMLAIDWHGFSRLRVYPLIFLIWVGILLVAIVVLEVRRNERFFTSAIVLASIGFAVSISLFNVDDAIVRYNVFRSTQGKHFNAPFLATLSLDAVPALTEAFQNPAFSNEVHEGIGAALVCHLNSDTIKYQPQNWQAFNLSYWRAKSALDGLNGPFGNYHLKSNKDGYFVETPHNISVQCQDLEPANND
jgi:hypothetical protein